MAHRRAVALAREIDDPRGLADALASIATAIYWPHLLQQRLKAAQEAWDLAEEMGLRNLMEDLRPFLMLDLIRVGDTSTLRRVLDEGLRLPQKSLSLYDLAICQHIEALVATGGRPIRRDRDLG